MPASGGTTGTRAGVRPLVSREVIPDTSEPSSKAHEAPQPSVQVLRGDARHLPLADATVDLVVTSPPYWRKRDYGLPDQIGQETTPERYVEALIDSLREWRRVLRPTGSVFLNIGDTYHKRALVGVPGLLEMAARADGWILRNRIIWAKPGGMPDPARDRLANRHEYVLHFARGGDYYYDLFGYSERFGNGANPGDVWTFAPARHMGQHPACFPRDIAERAIYLACPERVCRVCGRPERRIVRRTTRLDLSRPQARRALQIAREAGLSDAHLAAVQATGISDAGKALKLQNGSDRNSASVKRLASEAKVVLGGYFREFTFARRESVGWSRCEHSTDTIPGVVLDPFAGTGTTLQVAASLGRSAIGVDIAPVMTTQVPIPVGEVAGPPTPLGGDRLGGR